MTRTTKDIDEFSDVTNNGLILPRLNSGISKVQLLVTFQLQGILKITGKSYAKVQYLISKSRPQYDKKIDHHQVVT